MATKASPVKVSFEFDCTAFLKLEQATESNTAAQIRMVHDAIRPGVTHKDVATKLNEFRPDAVDPMTIGHYAQTAALAIGALTSHTSEHYGNDAHLIALFKVRTTGTADSRRAMVASWTVESFGPFPAYVAKWAKDVRAAKTAARSGDNAPATKGTGRKNDGADAPANKGTSAPVSLASIKFGDMLSEVSRRIEAETDAKRRGEMVKALKVIVLKAATPAPVAA